MSDKGKPVTIVGTGPAGMAAAYELMRHGVTPELFDRNDRVGGLARTIWREGYGFDIGPHRFFTKSEEVLSLWREVLGSDLTEVERLTRIFYNGKLFSYPLKPFDAFSKLGVLTTARALGSYVAQRFRHSNHEPANFEEWITRQFGKVLYDTFFKTYTEKVWGIPCDQIGKEWAGQRIRGLSLGAAVKQAFGLGRKSKVRSLVEHFYYPRLGAGQLYDEMRSVIEKAGGMIHLQTPVLGYHATGDRISSVTVGGSRPRDVPVEHLFVTAPITSVVQSLKPTPPADVLRAAGELYYRSHITVDLVVEGDSPFPDNWIYVHSPDFKMARIANYGSFSRDLIAEPGTTGIAVEYFCFEGDSIWELQDDELIELATSEMETAGLLNRSDVRLGFVIREADSYPTYYLGHQEHFDVLYDYLGRFRNLILMGRAGMYRYNNQDHAILTGIYAARNHLGITDADLFAVNSEEDYLEEVTEPEPPAVHAARPV